MIDKNTFIKQVDELIFYQDDINGAKLYRDLSSKDRQTINNDEELSGAYLVLQFLIIPFLPTKEIAGLLVEHLTAGLMVSEIDLRERITKKLVMTDLSDRDNCKRELKKALLDNREIITDKVEARGKKIKTASDWLKDYLSQIGLKTAKSLEQAKYFYEQSYVANLEQEDKQILHKIIDLYKFLNTSSLTPEGFEDDILLKDKDGRLLTTNKGKVVILYDPKKAEKKVATGVSQKAISINLSEREKQIIDLRKTASQYPVGSFERKAVEEEISRITHNS